MNDADDMKSLAIAGHFELALSDSQQICELSLLAL